MNLQTCCFERLQVIRDDVPRTGAVNMALDEIVFDTGVGYPTLRLYRWVRPSVSFGYFETADAARRFARGRPVVRRLTGGGMVEHGDDLTYTLFIPRQDSFARIRPGESYGRIHAAIGEALERCGLAAAAPLNDQSFLPFGLGDNGSACFERPVRYDLIVDGRKVAGAAQRRTRTGLMHQGSIRLDPMPASNEVHWKNRLRLELPLVLAAAHDVRSHSAYEVNYAYALASRRYSTAAWTNRL